MLYSCTTPTLINVPGYNVPIVHIPISRRPVQAKQKHPDRHSTNKRQPTEPTLAYPTNLSRLRHAFESKLVLCCCRTDLHLPSEILAPVLCRWNEEGSREGPTYLRERLSSRTDRPRPTTTREIAHS